MSRERLDIVVVTIAGALVGGRTGYLLINLSYFQEHPFETIQIWLGGFSWIGALSGALLAIFLATRTKRISFIKTTDDLLPLFTSTTVFIWLACWITGYAYGAEIDAWWGIPATNEWGEVTRRWPTQLLAVFTILSLHLLIEYFRNHKVLKTPGAATSLFLAGTSSLTFVISQFRADQVLHWRGIKLDIWVSIFLLALSASIALYCLNCQLRTRSEKTNASKHEN